MATEWRKARVTMATANEMKNQTKDVMGGNWESNRIRTGSARSCRHTEGLRPQKVSPAFIDVQRENRGT